MQIKERIRKAILWRFSKLKNKVIWLLKYVYFKVFRSKIDCNICGWKDNQFNSDNWHPHTICPNCNSELRHRLFVGIIENSSYFNIDRLIKNKNVLHFAPDSCLTKLLASNAKEYLTADFLTQGYHYANIDLNIDMSDMKEVEDERHDCIIAFDVLEHIPKHINAIHETYRVLKKGGFCIFTVPQKDAADKTIEDLTITDPKKREELFGQWDHWRIYGSDFKDMIASAGFEVQVLDEKSLDKEHVLKHVLYPPIKSKHPLATNNRKIYFGKKV